MDDDEAAPSIKDMFDDDMQSEDGEGTVPDAPRFALSASRNRPFALSRSSMTVGRDAPRAGLSASHNRPSTPSRSSIAPGRSNSNGVGRPNPFFGFLNPAMGPPPPISNGDLTDPNVWAPNSMYNPNRGVNMNRGPRTIDPRILEDPRSAHYPPPPTLREPIGVHQVGRLDREAATAASQNPLDDPHAYAQRGHFELPPDDMNIFQDVDMPSDSDSDINAQLEDINNMTSEEFSRQEAAAQNRRDGFT